MSDIEEKLDQATEGLEDMSEEELDEYLSRFKSEVASRKSEISKEEEKKVRQSEEYKKVLRESKKIAKILDMDLNEGDIDPVVIGYNSIYSSISDSFFRVKVRCRGILEEEGSVYKLEFDRPKLEDKFESEEGILSMFNRIYRSRIKPKLGKVGFDNLDKEEKREYLKKSF